MAINNNELTEKIKVAREMFINSELSVADIAKELNLNINTLYSRSSKEQWALLRKNKIKEIISERNMMLNDRKLRGIDFYSRVMDRCNALLEDNDIPIKDIKELVATHIMAEDRYFLLSHHALVCNEDDDNKDSNLGILQELASI